jgi:hypothetical protein
MYQVITQAIGFVATALQIGSFQCKSSRKLIFVQLCGNTAFLIHMFMLGAYSGCVSLLISVIRNLILTSRRPWAYWKGWPWLLVTANVAGALLTWESPFSLLPCIAVVSLTIAGWSRNGKKIRIANSCVASPAWLIYEFYAGSISGIVTELFTLCSVGISILRYGWKALDTTE